MQGSVVENKTDDVPHEEKQEPPKQDADDDNLDFFEDICIEHEKELKEKNNLTVDYGVLVQRGEGADELAVIPGGPADKAGIVENDIILEIDGQKIDKDKSLALIIREKKVGDTVTLKILSKGSEKTAQVKLDPAPES